MIVAKRIAFPGGSQHIRFTLVGTLVGAAEVVDGGYIANGRRKAVKTPGEAARQLIERKIKDMKAEVAVLEDLIASENFAEIRVLI